VPSFGFASCHPTKHTSWGPRLNELKHRGVDDILLAVVDGLKGFSRRDHRSEKEWRMPPREWTMAKAQFAVIFGERFIKAMQA